MADPAPIGKRYFYSKRSREGGAYCELYRCFDEGRNLGFSAHADRFGKPLPVFVNEEETVRITNRNNYLLNGRTDILCLNPHRLIGSYGRLGGVYDANDQKAGRWRDARKWRDEFKENLVDAVANTILGSGDVPGGVNSSNTHLLSNGKTLIGMLQREPLPFFPDPPKSMEPSKAAKLASRIIPGKLGKSLGEVSPPSGWVLTVFHWPESKELLIYSALVHLEYLRWARSA